jgi:hypothetical protein
MHSYAYYAGLPYVAIKYHVFTKTPLMMCFLSAKLEPRVSVVSLHIFLFVFQFAAQVFAQQRLLWTGYRLEGRPKKQCSDFEYNRKPPKLFPNKYKLWPNLISSQDILNGEILFGMDEVYSSVFAGYSFILCICGW